MKPTLLTTLLLGLLLTAGTTMPVHADDDVTISAMDPIYEHDERQSFSRDDLIDNLESHYAAHIRSEEMEENRRDDILEADLDEDAQRDIYCLTEAMYFESLGEPEKGKIAVANVIMNRANWTPSNNNDRNKHHYEFSKSICDVVNFKAPKIVYKKRGKVKKVMVCAFSYRCERAFHKKLARVQKKPVWNEIKTLATKTYLSYNSDENVDPTNGATFYHATWMRQYPSWARQYKRTTKIGLHQFYKIE